MILDQCAAADWTLLIDERSLSFDFQICKPDTDEPLADIWDVNHWIALRRQERFAELYGKENTCKLKASKTQDEKPKTNPGPSVLSKRVGFK